MGAAIGVLVVLLLGVSTVLMIVAARAARYQRRYRAITSVDEEVARLRVEAARAVDRMLENASADAERSRRDASQSVASALADAERVQSRARHELASVRQEAETLRAAALADISASRQQYEKEKDTQAQIASETARARAELDRLSAELKLVTSELDDIEFGLYRPHYRFDTTEEFERELARVYEEEKARVRSGAAVAGGDESARTQKLRKLLLRAFNGEADAAIAKVVWNNATQMEQRIRRAFETINQLGEAMTLEIAVDYRDLKLAELCLEHELATRRRDVIEDQRWFREQMKEEERARREAERVQAEAEAEETRSRAVLEDAKVALVQARGVARACVAAQLVELEARLADTRSRAARAKSVAALANAGYVYVVSNVGAFGPGMFKIGMTRRLDPADLVKELGDASVPFPFDVHAMVYADDAVALANAFQQRFRDRTVNLIDERRGFFHVQLPELEDFVRELGMMVAFTPAAEAREFRESLAKRATLPMPRASQPPDRFRGTARGTDRLAPIAVRHEEVPRDTNDDDEDGPRIGVATM